MRAAALAGFAMFVITVPAASAETFKPDVVFRGPRHQDHARVTPPGTSAFTSISHVIYMNNCMPNGCSISPGFDDSRTNHSSIADGNRNLPAWTWGQPQWDALVQCVKDTYAPFDITIVTTDPGPTANHSEIMIGGHSTDLNGQLQGAGGVAPFIACDGQLEDNVISFVFAGDTNSLNYLCGAVAQETSHVFGLDHEMNALDPMTYLDLGSHKVFQDASANCGEFQPRQCYCGTSSTQNSVRYLLDTFGPANLTPPTMTITAPAEGAWVKPGFPVRADMMSQLSIQTASLAIDGTAGAPIVSAPFVFNAPASLAGGDHTVTVAATDIGARAFSASVNVHVTGACGNGATCADGTHCLGGYCLPGSDVAGGLGATCTGNDSCITGTCAMQGADQLCTGACDAGNTCPSGYDCLVATNGAGVCWPASSSGGCSTSGGAPGLLLIGLGVVVLSLRRRSNLHPRGILGR